MIEIVGVRFKPVGRIYYFSPEQQTFHLGDEIVVNTKKGQELGTIVLANRQEDEQNVFLPLKPILRYATESDKARYLDNQLLAKEALATCQQYVKILKLPMSVLDSEYTLNKEKLIISFTSENRIDFRELVKMLASVYKTRIELRQIGDRDAAKILGGIGPCGRTLCCSTFLGDFAPVSIKMAKEQNLSLNPTKISGVCGRLMCCLKYENDYYEEMNQRLPDLGDTVMTEEGQGRVIAINAINMTITIKLIENERILDYSLEKYEMQLS